MNTPEPGDGSWGYSGHPTGHFPPPYGQGPPPPYATVPPYPQPAYGHPGPGYPPAYGVERPATVWVGVVLLVISAAPFLVLGVLSMVWSALAVPASELTGGVSTTEIENSVRGALAFGFLAAIVSLAYIALAVVAALGRSWARTMLAVLTTLFGLWMLVLVAVLFSVPGAASVRVLAVPVLAVLLASVGGMVVLYLPAHRPYYATRAR